MSKEFDKLKEYFTPPKTPIDKVGDVAAEGLTNLAMDMLERVAYEEGAEEVDRQQYSVTDPKGDLLDKLAGDVFNPKQRSSEEEENIINDILEMADETGLSIGDVNNNYIGLMRKRQQPAMGIAAMEPPKGAWNKFKRFFTGTDADRPYTPPNMDRIEKFWYGGNWIITQPLRTFFKYGKGATLGSADFMWAAIKRAVPEKNWNEEVRNMTLDEAMDWAAGYNPTGFARTVDEMAEFIGRFNSVSKLATKTGLLQDKPKHISTLGKAADLALRFGLTAAQEQTQKLATETIDPTETDWGYEGATAVLRDMAIGAAFSLLHSGTMAAWEKIWEKLTPSEIERMTKALGVSKDASVEEIRTAAREAADRYSPQAQEELRQAFADAIAQRATFLKEGDIIYRGVKTKWTPPLTEATKQEHAITKAIQEATGASKEEAIKIAQSAAKTVTPKAEKPTVPAPAEVQPPAGEAKQPWEMTKDKTIEPSSQLKSEADYVYHATNLENAMDISKSKSLEVHAPDFGTEQETWPDGLTENRAYFSDKANIVWQFAPEEGKPVVLRVKKSAAEFKTESTGDIYSTKTVPASEIEILTEDGWKPVVAQEALAKMEQPPAGETTDIVQQIQETTGRETLTDPEIDKTISDDETFRDLQNSGFVEIQELSRIRDAYHKAHDWLWTFGQAKRENPKLYKELMSAFGKRNAGIEKALSQLEKITVKSLSLDEDVALAIAYETKGGIPPEKLKDMFEKYSQLLKDVEEKQLAEGIFKQTFQERMIAENEARIDALKERLKRPDKSKQIQRLIAENEKLRNMRYLPHTVVARRVIEEKVNRLSGDKRRAFLDRLSYVYKKRTGKLTLKDYLDEELVTPDDIRMTRLAAETLNSYYYRSAMKALHDYAKANDLIKPSSDALRAEGWLNQREIGIVSPELKGQLVHPLYAESLREMVEMRRGRGSLRRQVWGMVKIGQFIKPTIIWLYNGVQKVFRGMYSVNPKVESSALRQAFRSVMNEDELYHKLNESNLFQFPYEVSRGTQEEQIKKWINQHDADVSKLMKWFEKQTDTNWVNPDITLGKLSRDLLTMAHRAVGRYTWIGDKVQRTQSYLVLRHFGYSHDDAVSIASKGHGGYSLLSKRYKDWASKYFFVYSFRVLMPMEMTKILTEPLIEGAYRYAKTGEKPSRPNMIRWASAFAGAVAVPFMIDSYMKWRGFEVEGKHLGPLAWKYKKTVVVNGEEYDVIVGFNDIINLPIKYWNRLSAYDPIDPSTRWLQATKNFVKWELHPLYRIFLWDIMQNRKSYGSGQNVYDTEANSIVQFGQIVSHIFGQSFRFFGQMMDEMGEGQLTEKERNAQEKVFNESLTRFDKVMFSVFGYKYIRMSLEERQAIAAARLRKEYVSRMARYSRKYEGKDLEKRAADLERWYHKIEEWIDGGMK